MIRPTPRIRRSLSLHVEQLESRLVLAATWPVPASHEMFNNFSTVLAANAFRFHEGIDIRASGNGGEPVVAARGGKIVGQGDEVGGWLVIEAVPGEQWDRYLHISDRTKDVGETVEPGVGIGKIALFHGAGNRHLHWEVNLYKELGAHAVLSAAALTNP